MAFLNHGCNGSYNVGEKLTETEMSANLGQGPAGVWFDVDAEFDIFNPFLERHFPQHLCSNFRALRDIEAGEELLDNYLVFGGEDLDEWEDNLVSLKSMCMGEPGKIFEYEEVRDS